MHFEIGKEQLRNPAIALHSTVRSLPFVRRRQSHPFSHTEFEVNQ